VIGQDCLPPIAGYTGDPPPGLGIRGILPGCKPDQEVCGGWSPSFECHVRPDGEHEYRIGQELVDQFLEFVVGRPVRTPCGVTPTT
jgi:hypothetical protein